MAANRDLTLQPKKIFWDDTANKWAWSLALHKLQGCSLGCSIGYNVSFLLSFSFDCFLLQENWSFVFFSPESQLCAFFVKVADVLNELSYALSKWKVCLYIPNCIALGTTLAVDCSSRISGRYVSLNAMKFIQKAKITYWEINEIEVFEGKFPIFPSALNLYSLFCHLLLLYTTCFR